MAKRIQRKRTRGWRMPAGVVYVGRPTAFGNPFNSVAAFEAWLVRGEIRLSALRSRGWFPWTPEKKRRLAIIRSRLLDRLEELRGKDLACWCYLGELCHADVLIKLANK